MLASSFESQITGRPHFDILQYPLMKYLDYLEMLKRLRDRVCLFFRRTFPRLLFLRPFCNRIQRYLIIAFSKFYLYVITLSGDLWDKSTAVSTVKV